MNNNFIRANESFGQWRERHQKDMEAWAKDAPSPCDQRCKFWHFMGGLGVGLLLLVLFLI